MGLSFVGLRTCVSPQKNTGIQPAPCPESTPVTGGARPTVRDVPGTAAVVSVPTSVDARATAVGQKPTAWAGHHRRHTDGVRLQ